MGERCPKGLKTLVYVLISAFTFPSMCSMYSV